MGTPQHFTAGCGDVTVDALLHAQALGGGCS